MHRNLFYRELRPDPLRYQRDTIVNSYLFERLGHSKTLKGHEGCVNCLQWNPAGTLLASGSDDMNIRLWNVEGKALNCIESGHTNNIFSVQFLPCGQDDIIISAAGDSSVRMHHSGSNVPFVWWSGGRVKRLAVTRADPHVFWSASEDGCVKQYDARDFVASNLITFDEKECKSLAINENRPEMIAVALNEVAVPLYDRRNVKEPLLVLAPGHIPLTDSTTHHVFRTLSVTHVGFNSLGNELIVNIGGEQIYIFNVLDRAHEPDVLESLNTLLEKPPSEHPANASEFVGFENTTTERFREIRERAKIHFTNREYSDAIDAYSRAILQCEDLCGHDPPRNHVHAMDLCLLLANRGASYLRRLWDGDAYAALIDLLRALKIEPRNPKIHYRIIKALVELRQYDKARKMYELYKERFPSDNSCEKFTSMLNSESGEQKKWESSGCSDYVQRLCGHCNTNTDIKEAVWFGGRDEYIAAGSDCGSLLIWERKSGALVRAFEADRNILNCVQPHPSIFLLATSGIEHVIRFWEPISENDSEDKSERQRQRHSLSALSAANQKRMHTGIFDMVVASIGLAVRAENEEEGVNPRRIGCNAS